MAKWLKLTADWLFLVYNVTRSMAIIYYKESRPSCMKWKKKLPSLRKTDGGFALWGYQMMLRDPSDHSCKNVNEGLASVANR